MYDYHMKCVPPFERIPFKFMNHEYKFYNYIQLERFMHDFVYALGDFEQVELFKACSFQLTPVGTEYIHIGFHQCVHFRTLERRIPRFRSSPKYALLVSHVSRRILLARKCQ